MNTRHLHAHWVRTLVILILTTATLACGIVAEPTQTPRPSQTPVPTWTPTPTFPPTLAPTTGEITGRVLDARSGSAVPGANVTTDPPTTSTTTDQSGQYTISEVPPGTYTITAAKPGYAAASVSIAVAVGKTTTADVHLATIPTTTPPAQQTSSGLIAHWSFDNCDGTDSSSNGLHGTIFGDPGCVDGVSGQALEFDGTDDWFSLQDMPKESYTVSDFTISLWFNTDQGTQQTLWQANDGRAWGLTGYGISIRDLGNIEVAYRAKSPDKCEMHARGDFEAGEWHHVVLVRDTGKKQGFLYVNGSLEDTCVDPDPDLSIEPQSYPRVGYGYYAPNNYERYFGGLMDDIRFYNRALDETEIQALHSGDTGLVAYYPFSGNADDASGNGNHGVVHGATLAEDRFGTPNSAYSFDGVDDYIAIPDNPILDISEEVTLSTWVYIRSFAGGEGIVSKVKTNSRSPWELGIETSTKQLRFMGGADYRENLFHASDDNSIELDRWYHIAGTASDGLAVLYIDGIKAASESYSGSFWKNEYDVFVGTRWTHTQRGNHYFNGLIDDVRIYNRALSEAEIQTLYNGDAGLVTYYPFSGSADDASGNGNHGVVHGATLAADRFGNGASAYSFDGVDDYIEIADSTSLDIEQQITIAAWVRFHSNPDGSSRIVDKSHTNCRQPWNMYGLRMCCKTNRFAFDVTTRGSNHILNSASGYSPDSWHFIVGTYDGSVQKLYVDGIVDSSSSASGPIGTNDEPLLIGKHRGCKSQHFNGVIDDVHIYNRALSEEEIQALYAEGN